MESVTEITIFSLKIMVKRGLKFFNEISPCLKNLPFYAWFKKRLFQDLFQAKIGNFRYRFHFHQVNNESIAMYGKQQYCVLNWFMGRFGRPARKESNVPKLKSS